MINYCIVYPCRFCAKSFLLMTMSWVEMLLQSGVKCKESGECGLECAVLNLSSDWLPSGPSVPHSRRISNPLTWRETGVKLVLSFTWFVYPGVPYIPSSPPVFSDLITLLELEPLGGSAVVLLLCVEFFLVPHPVLPRTTPRFHVRDVCMCCRPVDCSLP